MRAGALILILALGVFCQQGSFASAEPTYYCQPTNSTCWPTYDEIEKLKGSLTQPDPSCLQHFPTFMSKDEQGPATENSWFQHMPSLMTPYSMMSLRQHFTDRSAFFVVMARTDKDVSKAVKFAKKHKLALSVFGTGHEFQDRNAGLGDNGLVIRTTCLRDVQVELSPDNKYGSQDGYVRLGSGMTWGTSIFNLTGVHEIAASNDRVVVSGHAANVGIVGWSMGGGHSPLGPTYGLGVDQILEVEVIGPDGSLIIANGHGTASYSPDGYSYEFSPSSDLFWAMRGGGAGPWGAVTAMTMKLHKPKCSEKCYYVQTAVWTGKFSEDDGQMAVNLISRFFEYATVTTDAWSGYAVVLATGVPDQYAVVFSEIMFVGEENDPDRKAFSEFFMNAYPEMISYYTEKTYDTYIEKTHDQMPEPVGVSGYSRDWASVLLNQTVLTNQREELAQDLIDHWVPRCYKSPFFKDDCLWMFQVHLTVPRNGFVDPGTSVSDKFRKAKLHLTTSDAMNLRGQNLTSEENARFIHGVLGPMLYKYGEGSYYSESEHCLEDGQWQARLWDEKTYERLLEEKQTWDPEHVFGCRHCVGDGAQATGIDNKRTMPTWRRHKSTQH